MEQKLEKLLRKARQQGRTKVIIRLKKSLAPYWLKRVNSREDRSAMSAAHGM